MEKGFQGNIPILLLAAGSSSRMGQSKQLLSIHGKTLLQRITETCLSANTGRVIVALGARESEHRKKIQHLPVDIVSNPDWQKGMGSTIKVGINYINNQTPTARAVIISVCDQPHLTAQHLVQMSKEFEKQNQSIIASTYKKTRGVPALFDEFYFDALMQLEDTAGAKKIIQQYSNNVIDLPFPQGAIDLDTIEDYNTFNDNATSP